MIGVSANIRRPGQRGLSRRERVHGGTGWLYFCRVATGRDGGACAPPVRPDHGNCPESKEKELEVGDGGYRITLAKQIALKHVF